MPIGSSLGMDLPTPGVTTSWGTKLNTELQKIIDAVEGGVPGSALSIADDVEFNDNGLTEVERVQLNAWASPTTAAGNIYRNSSGDLYYVNGSNAAVQITSGSGLSGAGGSITGAGYGSSGVELNWTGSFFDFKSGSSTYANLRANSYRLYDGTYTVTLAIPSLAASSTYTLPAAPPGATELLTMASSGAIDHTAAPSVTSLTATGAVQGATVTGTTGVVPGAGSSTLSNYVESSTWTPQVELGGTEVTAITGGAYSVQTGYYCRVGDIVTYQFLVTFTTTSDQNNVTVDIVNLPLNWSVSPTTATFVGALGNCTATTNTAGSNHIFLESIAAQDACRLYWSDNASGGTKRNSVWDVPSGSGSVTINGTITGVLQL